MIPTSNFLHLFAHFLHVSHPWYVDQIFDMIVVVFAAAHYHLPPYYNLGEVLFYFTCIKRGSYVGRITCYTKRKFLCVCVIWWGCCVHPHSSPVIALLLNRILLLLCFFFLFQSFLLQLTEKPQLWCFVWPFDKKQRSPLHFCFFLILTLN